MFEQLNLIRFIADAPNEAAIFDRDMRYLAASKSWIKTYRLNEDIIGACHYDLFPELPEAWKAVHQRGMAGERSFAEGEAFRRLDGSEEWLDWEVRPWRKIDGSVGGIIIFSENVTKLKQRELELETSERRLRLAQEAARMGIWDWDLITGHLFTNDQQRSLFGFTCDEKFDYAAFLSIIHPDDRPNVEQIVAQGWAGRGPVDSVFRIHRKNDGAERWIAGKGKVILDASGTPIRMTGVNFDITMDKEREIALEEHRLKLHKQAEELILLNRSVEAANHAKTAFIAAMSHEIRTPLNAIVGFSYLISKARSDDERQQFIDTLIGSTRHLKSLVNDILDFTKLEAGYIKLDDDSVNLDVFLSEIGTTLRALIGEKPIESAINVDDDLPLAIRTDRARLTQILLNLISNAAKFTESGSIQLRVQKLSSVTNESRIRFAVIDTGPGISASTAPKLFQAFQQGDASKEIRASGAGLGLVISRMLARMMGGDIGFETKEGKGSRFWFEAPFQIPAPQIDERRDQPVAIQDSRPAARPLNILIADDSSASRAFLKIALTQRGHLVEDAEDGRKALLAAMRKPFDIIFMDVQMPVLDGLEAARSIRALSGPAGATPIVALTAHAFEEQTEEALGAGMDKVLTKPLDMDRIELMLLAVSQTGSVSHT